MAENGDKFCSIEGVGIRERLDNLRDIVKEPANDKEWLDAEAKLRALSAAYAAGEITRGEALGKSCRVVDELFAERK